MAFCTKCAGTVNDYNQFCGTCGAARSSKPAAAAVEVTGAVERDAKVRLKREHDKLLASIGMGSGVATLVCCVLLLVLADTLGHVIGGILVGCISLICGVLFVRSFKAEFAEMVNRSLSSPSRIDPLSGEPLRMVWWFRWLTAVVSIFMLVALSDYLSPPPPATASSASASASNASANDVPAMTASPSADPQTQQYVAGLQAQMKTLKMSTDQFSALMTAPRLNDATWKLEVAAQLATWRAAYTEAHRFDGVLPST
jgi:hypothetical protein